MAATDDVKAQPQEGCERMVIFPPTVADAYTSRRVADAWVASTQSLFPHCYNVVPIRKTFFMFSTFEVDHRTIFGPDAITPAQWRKVAEDDKATLIVVLRYDLNEDGAFIEPSFWRYPATEVRFEGQWAKRRQLPVAIRMNGFQRSPLSRELLKLGPNSVTINASNAEPVNKSSISSEYRTVEEHEQGSYALDQLGLLGFATVTHPDYFATWDGRIQLTGSQTLGYWNRRYKFRRRDDQVDTGPEYHYAMRFGFIAPTLDVLMTGHTPIGSFYAQVGAGLATYYLDDSYKSSVFGFRPVIKYGFGYRAFINDFLFTQLGVEIVKAEHRFVKNQFMHFDQISTASLGLGFFVPGWEWRLCELASNF